MKRNKNKKETEKVINLHLVSTLLKLVIYTNKCINLHIGIISDYNYMTSLSGAIHVNYIKYVQFDKQTHALKPNTTTAAFW